MKTTGMKTPPLRISGQVGVETGKPWEKKKDEKQEKASLLFIGFGHLPKKTWVLSEISNMSAQTFLLVLKPSSDYCTDSESRGLFHVLMHNVSCFRGIQQISLGWRLLGYDEEEAACHLLPGWRLSQTPVDLSINNPDMMVSTRPETSWAVTPTGECVPAASSVMWSDPTVPLPQVAPFLCQSLPVSARRWFVCSLSPSHAPRCSAASSEQTRPPSSPAWLLWTRHTPTPANASKLRSEYFTPYNHFTLLFTASYLRKVELLEHGDADLVVQSDFHLKLFDPQFADGWKKTKTF